MGEEGGEVVVVDGRLNDVAGLRSQCVNVERGGPVAAAPLQLVDVAGAAQVEFLEAPVDAAPGPAEDRPIEVRPGRDESEGGIADLVDRAIGTPT